MKESELFRALEIDAKELEAISKQYDRVLLSTRLFGAQPGP